MAKSGRRKKHRGWGLIALSRHGDLKIDIDERLDGSGYWELDLQSRRWSVRFGIAGKRGVRALSRFVSRYAGQTVFAKHRIGAFRHSIVGLIKDEEFADRFFLTIDAENWHTRITLVGRQAHSFRNALEDIVAQLADSA